VIRAVVDINVLVGGLVAHYDSPEAKVIDAWQAGRFQLVVSRHIREMLAYVLRLPEFDYITEETKGLYLAHVRWSARSVQLTRRVYGVAPDGEDDKVLATALSGDASYVVTRDRQFLEVGSYKTVQIVRPEFFMNVLDGQG